MNAEDLQIATNLHSGNLLHPLTEMTLELWPECDYSDERKQWEQINNSGDHFCAVAKYRSNDAGFIHISIRNDYVEGTDTNKTAYLEALYVRAAYRKKLIASALLKKGEEWVMSKGLNQLASDTELHNTISQHFHSQSGFEEKNRIVCYIKKLS